MAEFNFNADPKKSRRKILLAVGGVLALAGFGWLIWTDWRALEETRGKIEDARLRLDKAQAEISRTPAVEDNVILLRETVKEYVKILPDDKEINSFVDQLTQFARETGVRITKLDDQDARARVQKSKKGAQAAFDRVVYRLSLDGYAEQFLQFTGLFENHERFVRIPALKVEAGTARTSSREETPEPSNADAPAGGAAPHNIDLELETYVYNPKLKSAGAVEIPDEARKLERLRATRAVDFDARKDLALVAYEREPRTRRRDLFVDPRRKPDRSGDDAVAKKVQEELLAKMKAELDACVAAAAEEAKQTNVVRRLKAAQETETRLAALHRLMREAEEGRAFTLEPLKKRYDAEIKGPFAKAAQGRDLAGRTAALAADQADDALKKMRSASVARRWDEVAALAADVLRRQTGREAADVAGVFAEIRKLAETAELELAFDARPLVFGGTVIYRDATARSVAIINGRPYMPGDRLDEETKVVAISSSEVEFDFRDRRVVRSVKPAAAEKKSPAKGDRRPKKS
ncbi:MAG TPA: hypothetical protein VEI02_14555 [Planctomycetota bacterium]|nr:hypothetical protein [Planctomycetota bacterium]